jgi:hypothetical protein
VNGCARLALAVVKADVVSEPKPSASVNVVLAPVTGI